MKNCTYLLRNFSSDHIKIKKFKLVRERGFAFLAKSVFTLLNQCLFLLNVVVKAWMSSDDVFLHILCIYFTHQHFQELNTAENYALKCLIKYTFFHSCVKLSSFERLVHFCILMEFHIKVHFSFHIEYYSDLWNV